MAKGPECIEIRHLRYFLAAAEYGSFRKAAAVLDIQPSAISRRIRDLEDRLGASLFHRQSGGVLLTHVGHRYQYRVRKILRNFGEGSQEIAAAGRSEYGRVRIGICSSIASGFLAELLSKYGSQFGDVRLELIDGYPNEHTSEIRKLNLDIAFLTGTRPWPGCERAMMWSEGVFAVLPEYHVLANRAAVRWHDLGDEIFIVSEAAPGQEIYDYLVKNLAELGWHPEIQVQSVSRDTLLPLVALGRGLTLISEAMTVATYPGVVYRPIRGECLPFSAVWSQNNDNPAFRRLLSMARTKSASETGGAVSGYSPAIAQHAAPSQTPDPSP
ncbi:LysR family transcriptional regulator [Salipiger abyssi]|uniref:LysR family transcriptional regulator n=1 Tax=Salipiger abyssi TaxID=1250539 RepID=UPI0018DE88A6|nr:LysR family transcriptional regulator [Salipiger abyssi]